MNISNDVCPRKHCTGNTSSDLARFRAGSMAPVKLKVNSICNLLLACSKLEDPISFSRKLKSCGRYESGLKPTLSLASSRVAIGTWYDDWLLMN
mmetsp:Transcript_15833/g.25860  ORF Transcript_15833/g.25860 Transcript_15833/m.25860 type:complete len:94 (+) Transcript_15833:1947-2228(+)